MARPVGKSLCRGLGGIFVSATPILVLGFAVFVIALNIRHYSTMCDTGDGRQGDLFATAMERRIRTLENEINQNRLLTEKVLQGLDVAFRASQVLSVEELRLLAQTEAAEIGQRRARQPPPPMSEFARSRVSDAVEGGKLQDLVEAAVGAGPDASATYVPPAEAVGAQGGGAAANGGLNQGWDWESQPYAADDDFLGGVHVEVAKPAELDVPEEQRKSICSKWLEEHGVTPMIDWGTLPVEEQKLWVRYSCDEIALEVLAAARSHLPVESPPEQAPPPGRVSATSWGN
ncbi:unnamed protein product, partial [Scytosiphon promiscuus]